MSKSSHHKKENTYKFQTFADQLKSVNIDVSRRISRQNYEIEETETHFGNGILRWTELNCTDDFGVFLKDIRGYSNNLAQVIHHKDDIVQALLLHLRKEKSLAIQPLLDLVAQLAKDLQGDLYDDFREIFDCCILVINRNHHEVDILEQSFLTLAFLFKFLWRSMVKDIYNVYRIFSPLLCHRADYVRAFAAESFAFLMRKVHKHAKFFQFIIKLISDEPQQADGVGRLLFEMFKGVPGQLHNITSTVLPLLLDTLSDTEVNRELVQITLMNTMSEIAEFVLPDKCSVVWDVLLSRLETPERAADGHMINTLLQILYRWTHYRKGYLVNSMQRHCQVYTNLLENEELNSETVGLVLSCVSATLMAEKNHPVDSTRTTLISAVFSRVKQRDIVFKFVRETWTLSLMEKDLLPQLLKYCSLLLVQNEENINRDVLFLMVDIIMLKRKSPSDVGEELPILLDFSRSQNLNTKFGDYICTQVKSYKQAIDSADLSTLWGCCLCAAHTRPINQQQLVKDLTSLISWFSCQTDASDDLVYVASEAVATVVRICSQDNLASALPAKIVLDTLVHYAQHPAWLHSCDLYLTKLKNSPANRNVLSHQQLENLLPSLADNFQSPVSAVTSFLLLTIVTTYLQVRNVTARICSLFDVNMPDIHCDQLDVERCGLFNIIRDAESVGCGLREYRQRLMHMRKLDASVVAYQLPEGPFHLIPLRYFLGCLHIGLSVLWKPVIELIASHAKALDIDQFWSIFQSELAKASTNAEKALRRDKPDNVISDEPSADLQQLFQSYCRSLHGADRTDWVQYRHQLWSSMQEFPDCCEQRSRIVSPLFLRFLENEYNIVDESMLETEDLRKAGSNLEVEEDDIEAKEHKPRRAANRSLVVHLQVFAKFKNPRSVSMEKRLTPLYHQLLEHKHALVQKVAFDCLMTYRHPYLTPYKENFHRLLDDGHFKEEIVRFDVSSDSNILSADHRKDVLPILCKILFGKMLTKAGKDTAGRSNSNQRRGIVLRFFSALEPHELQSFLDLSIHKFHARFQGDLMQTVSNSMTSPPDAMSVSPLRKQKGFIATIGVIVDNMGFKVPEFFHKVLHILLCLTAENAALLRQREELQFKAVKSLKLLRPTLIAKIAQICGFLDPLQEDETDAIFKAVVDPSVGRLVDEGLNHPTALLKLFLMWSSHTRYMPLLLRKVEDVSVFPKMVSLHRGDVVTPLDAIFCLLLHKDVAEVVKETISDLVINLLGDKEASDENCGKEKAPFPICLIIPYMEYIMEYIESVIYEMSRKSKRREIPSKALHIISSVSAFVSDPAKCCQLVGLLIPFLGSKSAKVQAAESDILATCRRLLAIAGKESTQYYPMFCQLFSSISARKSRDLICDLLAAISIHDEDLVKVTTLCRKMNAWDRKRVDEPNYLERLDGFREAVAMLDCSSLLWTATSSALLHNAAYYVNTSEDMSLRDGASLSLKQLIDCIEKRDKDPDFHGNDSYTTLITQKLLPMVKSGLRSSNESCQHENIGIFRHMVVKFPSQHPFRELHPLLDKNDVDADVFLSLSHIQLHRRTKGLRRLIRLVEGGTTFTSEVVTSYLLPVVTSFVRNMTYLKNNYLVDTAVEATAVLAKLLPWGRFQLLLRHYITELARVEVNQKTVIKVVVALLDVFSFDLSAASTSSSNGNVEVTTNEVETEAQDDVVEKDEDMNAEEGSSDSDDNPAQAQPEINSKFKLDRTHAVKAKRTLERIIIPQLKAALTQKTASDASHKRAPSEDSADDETLRVPIALAIVKLLQRLGDSTLSSVLPSILLKVCCFLRSRALAVRNAATSTLMQIAKTVGVAYLPYIVRELQAALLRGYQRHVLAHTTYSLLREVKPLLFAGALDTCISDLVQIFRDELFGEVAQEKEVQEISSQLHEAKSSKGLAAFGILAQSVSDQSMSVLLLPLKEELNNTHSLKVSRRLRDVLKRVGSGLAENDAISLSKLLTFVYSLSSEASVSMETKKTKNENNVSSVISRYDSCLMLPREPQRGGERPRKQARTNAAILVEFGLHLLLLLLRRGKLRAENKEHLQLLDPFVPVLRAGLESRNVQVMTQSMRCFTWMVKFPLPEISAHVIDIVATLFVLLSNYASAGAAKGENAELVQALFAIITVIIREVSFYTITSDQLRVLLSYCEQDIHDHSRQTTAFTLLKTILSRKLMVPEIADVVTKVQELSITADAPSVRQQARQVVLLYILDYPIGNKLRDHLEFQLLQLEYEHESGRESAVEMLCQMFASFPPNVLQENADFFFVPLAKRLANEESSSCKRKVSQSMKMLLNKVDESQRDVLFSMVLAWLKEEKDVLVMLGAQACGLFVDVETSSFGRRLGKLLPTLSSSLLPDKSKWENNSTADHKYYLLLNLFLKILRECALQRDKFSSDLNTIWESATDYLLHPHTWVRLVSSQLFGLLFSKYSAKQIVEFADNPGKDFISKNVVDLMQTLCRNFCSQFMSKVLEDELANQVVKNIIFCAKVLKTLCPGANADVETAKRQKCADLGWLLKRLSREARFEAANNPKVIAKRQQVFKIVAAIALDLGEDAVKFLDLLLNPLVRENTSQSSVSGEELNSLCQEVLEVIKNVVGTEAFTSHFAQSSKVLSQTRQKRKATKQQEAVANPEIAAKRKMKKNIAKTATKKRKHAEPLMTSKRKKVSR